MRERAGEGEARLKQALDGFLVGGIVRAYLPQTWTILTEQEGVTIHADVQGNIRVMNEIAPTRDGSTGAASATALARRCGLGSTRTTTAEILSFQRFATTTGFGLARLSAMDYRNEEAFHSYPRPQALCVLLFDACSLHFAFELWPWPERERAKAAVPKWR